MRQRRENRLWRKGKELGSEFVSWKLQGLLALFNLVFSLHLYSTLPNKITLHWIEFSSKALFLSIGLFCLYFQGLFLVNKWLMQNLSSQRDKDENILWRLFKQLPSIVIQLVLISITNRTNITCFFDFWVWITLMVHLAVFKPNLQFIEEKRKNILEGTKQNKEIKKELRKLINLVCLEIIFFIVLGIGVMYIIYPAGVQQTLLSCYASMTLAIIFSQTLLNLFNNYEQINTKNGSMGDNRQKRIKLLFILRLVEQMLNILILFIFIWETGLSFSTFIIQIYLFQRIFPIIELTKAHFIDYQQHITFTINLNNNNFKWIDFKSETGECKEECSICKDLIFKGRELPCGRGHFLHQLCLEQLFESKSYLCPLCRYDFSFLFEGKGRRVEEMEEEGNPNLGENEGDEHRAIPNLHDPRPINPPQIRPPRTLPRRIANMVISLIVKLYVTMRIISHLPQISFRVRVGRRPNPVRRMVVRPQGITVTDQQIGRVAEVFPNYTRIEIRDEIIRARSVEQAIINLSDRPKLRLIINISSKIRNTKIIDRLIYMNNKRMRSCHSGLSTWKMECKTSNKEMEMKELYKTQESKKNKLFSEEGRMLSHRNMSEKYLKKLKRTIGELKDHKIKLQRPSGDIPIKANSKSKGPKCKLMLESIPPIQMPIIGEKCNSEEDSINKRLSLTASLLVNKDLDMKVLSALPERQEVEKGTRMLSSYEGHVPTLNSPGVSSKGKRDSKPQEKSSPTPNTILQHTVEESEKSTTTNYSTIGSVFSPTGRISTPQHKSIVNLAWKSATNMNSKDKGNPFGKGRNRMGEPSLTERKINIPFRPPTSFSNPYKSLHPKPTNTPRSKTHLKSASISTMPPTPSTRNKQKELSDVVGNTNTSELRKYEVIGKYLDNISSKNNQELRNFLNTIKESYWELFRLSQKQIQTENKSLNKSLLSLKKELNEIINKNKKLERRRVELEREKKTWNKDLKDKLEYIKTLESNLVEANHTVMEAQKDGRESRNMVDEGNKEINELRSKIEEEEGTLNYYQQRENKLMYLLFTIQQKGYPIKDIYESEVKNMNTSRFLDGNYIQIEGTPTPNNPLSISLQKKNTQRVNRSSDSFDSKASYDLIPTVVTRPLQIKPILVPTLQIQKVEDLSESSSDDNYETSIRDNLKLNTLLIEHFQNTQTSTNTISPHTRSFPQITNKLELVSDALEKNS